MFRKAVIVIITLVAAVVASSATTASGSAAPDVATPAPSVGAVPDLDVPGPYRVTASAPVSPCRGPGAAEQIRSVREQGARSPLLCTDAAPIGRGPDRGVDLYLPEGAPGARPLIVFVAGSGANPGYFVRTVTHWASHGFVVAVAYDAREIAPESTFAGIRRAVAADADPTSPAHGRIDTGRVVLAGHSAGAAKALEAASLVAAPPPTAITDRIPLTVPAGVRVVGVLAVAPDIYTVVGRFHVPTLVTSGSEDRTARPEVLRPLLIDRLAAPTWFVVARGNQHLVAIDPVSDYPLTRIQLAFLEFVTGDSTRCPDFVGDAPTVLTDPALTLSVRTAAARSLSCAR
ncbi:alpha/beta fold hydrolase [Williamsia sp. MIQD14]|uniref:alpha/beta fold hydrolase n=1 Tax=Williamsia sp. MIQD14 TaxID=3425703 RepID=UPI003D9FC2F8